MAPSVNTAAHCILAIEQSAVNERGSNKTTGFFSDYSLTSSSQFSSVVRLSDNMSHAEFTNNVHDALDSELDKKLKQLCLLKTPERVRRKPVYLGDDEDHSHRWVGRCVGGCEWAGRRCVGGSVGG